MFLNTPEAVFELLDKRGTIYSDRPHFVMANELYVVRSVFYCLKSTHV